MDAKPCFVCEATKPVEEFVTGRNLCRLCHAARAKARREAIKAGVHVYKPDPPPPTGLGLHVRQARLSRRAVLLEIDTITETVEEWDARVEREAYLGEALGLYYDKKLRRLAFGHERWDWKPSEWVLGEVEANRERKDD